MGAAFFRVIRGARGWHAWCCHGRAMLSAEIESWDDEPTLVHAMHVSFAPPSAVLTIPPPLPACLSRVHHELDADEAWLASLPAAARAVLEAARRPRTLDAPRLPFAVARPLH